MDCNPSSKTTFHIHWSILPRLLHESALVRYSTAVTLPYLARRALDDSSLLHFCTETEIMLVTFFDSSMIQVQKRQLRCRAKSVTSKQIEDNNEGMDQRPREKSISVQTPCKCLVHALCFYRSVGCSKYCPSLCPQRLQKNTSGSITS